MTSLISGYAYTIISCVPPGALLKTIIPVETKLGLNERHSQGRSVVRLHLKALEEELQVQLLERHGRKFTVTPAGRYFYEQAKKQVQALDSAVREVRRIASGEYQRLRVGVLNGFSARIIQKTVQSFTASHPHVRLSLTTGTHEELFHPVNEGSLEMSDAGAFITGSTFLADGGATASYFYGPLQPNP